MMITSFNANIKITREKIKNYRACNNIIDFAHIMYGFNSAPGL